MPTETVLESNDIETVAPARVGDTLGYARVSTHDQNPDAQSDRLIEAGAIRVFTDIVSGKRFDRPALAELIDHARPGDRLCIIRLDRLGRSLRELLETVDGLKARAVAPYTFVKLFAGQVLDQLGENRTAKAHPLLCQRRDAPLRRPFAASAFQIVPGQNRP